VSAVPDVRRLIAFRAYGAVRLVNEVQGALEDVEGAVAAGQFGVAAFQARLVVLECLSIRGLATEGEIDFAPGSASFDFFAGVPPGEIESRLSLAHEALDLDRERAGDWLARLKAYVAETEELFGNETALPVLRSPEGAFSLVALTRRWAALLDELGLPPPVPLEWTWAQRGTR